MFSSWRIPLCSYRLVVSSVAAEIEAIRAGKWDSEIEKDIAVDETTSDKLASSPQSEVCLSIRLTL